MEEDFNFAETDVLNSMIDQIQKLQNDVYCLRKENEELKVKLHKVTHCKDNEVMI